MGSAGQRKARGDPYGANLVLQAAPSLDLARMQEADRVTPWHRRFRHWVFRTETRTSLHGGRQGACRAHHRARGGGQSDRKEGGMMLK